MRYLLVVFVALAMSISMSTNLAFAARCTGEQIQKMISSGFSKDEVKSLCGEPDTPKENSPASLSELKLGTYRARGLKENGRNNDSQLRIKIESIDPDGNVKAQLNEHHETLSPPSEGSARGKMRGKIDGKILKLEGYISYIGRVYTVSMDMEYQGFLKATIEDGTLTNGEYTQVFKKGDTAVKTFPIAELEDDN